MPNRSREIAVRYLYNGFSISRGNSSPSVLAFRAIDPDPEQLLENPLFVFFFRASANTSSSARCETEPEPEKVLPTLTPNNYFSDKAPIGFCSDGLLSQEHTARAASFVTAYLLLSRTASATPPPSNEPGELVYRHTYHSGQGCPAARTGVNAASTASRRIQARRRCRCASPCSF